MKSLLFAPLALAACATVPADTGNRAAGFGQTATVGSVRVNPLALVEDSRCPQAVQCVWAGRVRITAAVAEGGRDVTREFTLGQPLGLATGSLTLIEAMPAPRADQPIALTDYRFRFSFERNR